MASEINRPVRPKGAAACLTTVLTTFALTSLVISAETAGGEGGWEFQLTPYVWLPTISGDLNYEPSGDGGNPGSGAPAVDVGPTDWLDLLNGVFLLQAEMRKNRFLAFTDVVYLGLESDDDRVKSVSDRGRGNVPIERSSNLKTGSDIDGFTVTLAGGYKAFETERASLDIFAGARFFGLEAESEWNLRTEVTRPGGDIALEREGSVESEEDSWDAIVGIKGARKIGTGKWSLPYYVDVGTGDSDLTWQVIAGASYTFGWGDLMMSYRHFAYDGGPGGLMQNFSFSGPVIGGRFHF